MNVEHIAPLDLPMLPLSAHAELPECPAVYFVIGEDDAILYVGRASGLRARWIGHHRTLELAGLGAVRIAWLAVSDAGLLPAIEDACVAYFAPRLNGTRVVSTDVRVLLSLRPDVARELKEAAEEEGLAVAALARRCIMLYLRERRQGRAR